MLNYTIKYGESLIDVSLKLYGSVVYVFDLVKLNPNLENISNTDISGMEIVYEQILVTPFKPIVTITNTITKNVTISDSQNIFDLSLQIYGTVENVFDVLKLTNISDINEVDLAGINFNYEFIGTKIPKFLNDKNIKVATKYPIDLNNYRITEDNEFRITEDDNKRILE